MRMMLLHLPPVLSEFYTCANLFCLSFMVIIKRNITWSCNISKFERSPIFSGSWYGSQLAHCVPEAVWMLYTLHWCMTRMNPSDWVTILGCCSCLVSSKTIKGNPLCNHGAHTFCSWSLVAIFLFGCSQEEVWYKDRFCDISSWLHTCTDIFNSVWLSFAALPFNIDYIRFR